MFHVVGHIFFILNCGIVVKIGDDFFFFNCSTVQFKLSPTASIFCFCFVVF